MAHCLPLITQSIQTIRTTMSTTYSSTFEHTRRLFLTVTVSLLLLLQCLPTVSAYRKGDAVETGILLHPESVLSSLGFSDAEMTPTLRSQMPKFGINSRIVLYKEKDKDKTQHGGFTLLFEEGLRSMEQVPYTNSKGEHLEKIQVQFVYSKSGAGVIHSVWLKAKEYSRQGSSLDPVQVEYLWTEEKPIHLTAGYGICFLLCFIASIIALVYSCVLEDEETEAEYQQQYEQNYGMNAQRGAASNSHRRAAYGGYNAHKHI